MRIALLIAAAVAALTMTATAGAHIIRPGCNSHLAARAELRCARLNYQHALATIAWVRQQQKAVRFLNATPTLRLQHLVNDHRWLAHVMAARIAEAQRRLTSTIPLTGDWLTAVRLVQRAFPGSEGWLESCSASEGGHGIWVWNGGAPASSSSHGSGAGGWLQYMEGTFWTDYRQAVTDARRRGFVVPSGAASFYSATGQAIAGGWAYSHARWTGKWTGGRC